MAQDSCSHQRLVPFAVSQEPRLDTDVAASTTAGTRTGALAPDRDAPRRYRAGFAYIDATLTDGDHLKLFRLRYAGSASQWGFAIYTKTTNKPSSPAAGPQAPLKKPSTPPAASTSATTPPGSQTPDELTAIPTSILGLGRLTSPRASARITEVRRGNGWPYAGACA
jgi:hypothetical protein